MILKSSAGFDQNLVRHSGMKFFRHEKGLLQSREALSKHCGTGRPKKCTQFCIGIVQL